MVSHSYQGLLELDKRQWSNEEATLIGLSKIENKHQTNISCQPPV